MRGLVRSLLVGFLVLGLFASVAFAQNTANCPLRLVGGTPPGAAWFYDSPHGNFRNGAVMYSLHGRTLTTYSITELGDVSLLRTDVIPGLVGDDVLGGTAYSAGYLFITTEAGLEIIDLRNVHGGRGATAPVYTARLGAPHYRNVAASGSLVAALQPGYELPCAPYLDLDCRNWIDIFSVADPAAPVRIARIPPSSQMWAFNDVAFNNGFLYATGLGGTAIYDINNPSAPSMFQHFNVPGTFLVSNGTSLLGVGQEQQIAIYAIGPTFQAALFTVLQLPSIPNRANPLMFHPQAAFTESGLVTLIDEKDRATQLPARTIAIDMFDFTVPMYHAGSDDRIYETVSFTEVDEVKWDPMVVGPYIHLTGELSGKQVYGVCNQVAGKIEFDRVSDIPCGGSDIHGWVVGSAHINSVELMLDDQSLGFARLGALRRDVPTRSPAIGWNIMINLDAIGRGEHTLRAIATDTEGRRRQFASKNVFFPGGGGNCTNRRSRTIHR